MSRQKRIQVPGLMYHVMSRGNGRMRIFLDDVDCRKFLFVLGDIAEALGVECCDYCLMPTHYHLSLRPRQPNLSEAIRQLNSVYAMWWNDVHATVGHVFQGRFKSQVVQREGYLLALCRYIALNPVRAGLVTHPEQWQWSSYRATAGLCANPGFLASDAVLTQFGDGDVALQRSLYRQHVLGVLPDEGEMERLRSKERVVGDRSFRHAVLRQRAALESVPMGVSLSDPVKSMPTAVSLSDPVGSVPMAVSLSDVVGSVPMAVSLSDAVGSVPMAVSLSDAVGSVPMAVSLSDAVGSVPMAVSLSDAVGSVPMGVSLSDAARSVPTTDAAAIRPARS